MCIAHYTDDISITEGFASAETTQGLSVRPWGILGAFRSPKHLPNCSLISSEAAKSPVGTPIARKHRRGFSCAIAPLIDCSRRSRQLIAGSALSVEALTAEHGTVATGLEGHLGGLAAVRAHHVIHLTGSGRTVAVLGATSRAALRAARGLVHEALLGEESLLGRGEHEFLAAVAADKRFIFVHGWETSFKLSPIPLP